MALLATIITVATNHFVFFKKPALNNYTASVIQMVINKKIKTVQNGKVRKNNKKTVVHH